MNDFTNEVRSRWGDTEAYNEYQSKTKGYTKEKLLRDQKQFKNL